MDGLGSLVQTLLSQDLSGVPSPAFIIDKGALRANLAVLEDVQRRAGCKILLALKGFAAWNLAPMIRQVLPGIAASSPHEARLGFEEFAGEVHTYSPAFVPDKFDEVIKFSDHILFNSFAQWQRYKPAIEASGKAIECGIRVNPQHSEVSTPIYDPCAPGSRLGVSRDAFRPDQLDGISGLHFHNLCELGADALARTLASFEEQFGEFLPQLTWVNFGGGHLITAPDYDREHLIQIVRDFRRRHDVEVILEPGEAIAIRTGILVSTVLDIVTNGGVVNAILDTSACAHMPDVLEMPYRPEVVGSGVADEKAHTYRLGGVSCLAGDIIGDYSFDTELQAGDRVVFLDMSHYSMVKTTNFNGVQLPHIMTFEPDTANFELVREFGYESYKSRLGGLRNKAIARAVDRS
ncbi:MAG: carboxynorspermidine decarboxylase [Kofleriaceae bacterium]|nr:carboxynorspermidine decarboxylase [Kofleriaceae bacterium]